MKLNYDKDWAEWLTKKRLENFQEVVAKDGALAFDTLYHGRTGYKEYSEEDVIEELGIWDLVDQAIEDDILIEDTEFREFITQCPECGQLDSLQVIFGDFSATKLMLHADGFDFAEAKEVHTENEIVECRACNHRFALEDLKYEDDEDND